MDLPADHPHAPKVEKPQQEPYRDAAIHESARVQFEKSDACATPPILGTIPPYNAV